MGFFFPLLHLVLISLSIGAGPGADAWGNYGHALICQIAQVKLKEDVTRVLWDVLDFRRLSDLCSWADYIKEERPGTAPLHYANIPFTTPTSPCRFDFARDCANRQCVVGAIEDTAQDLRNRYRRVPRLNMLNESLLFLAHFMGDVHQPLHVGFARDQGGVGINPVNVRWLDYSEQHNLHKVWDTTFLETQLLKFFHGKLDAIASCIQAKYDHGRHVLERQFSEYATESAILACSHAYTHPDGTWVQRNSVLADPYLLRGLPVVERRIIEAGTRLAMLLNDIFRTNQVDESVQIE